MKRMSFALTERQLLDGSKQYTRRLGWRSVQPGERIVAIRKGMGLKKGQRQVVLALIEVVSVRFERVNDITQAEVVGEGFPNWTPSQFIGFFCKANHCLPTREITRIHFKRL